MPSPSPSPTSAFPSPATHRSALSATAPNSPPSGPPPSFAATPGTTPPFPATPGTTPPFPATPGTTSSVFASGGPDGSGPSNGWVVLTFDDGPSSFRPRTLEVLRRETVPAVFFDVGMRVAANPQFAAFQAREGHQVLNHTFTHPRLATLTPEAIRREIIDTDEALRAAGVRMPFRGMRPPFLAVDDAGRDVLAGLGYRTIVGVDVFAADPDAATTPEQIRDSLLAGLAPGAILLLHDGNVDTPSGRAAVTALPEIIRGVREHGYGFGLLDEHGAVVPAGPLQPCAEPIPPIVNPVPYLPLVEQFRGDPPQDPPPPYVIVESPHS
ncbi:polysaccharide deacetylase family protein [Actinoplanes sp. NPDC049265]|uniref:polysaccharide deacetylase family protein n=1 Tax=Actinoplanes sp. NPDC049265 TaxID=3363902 RepID=UPI003714CB13